MKIAFFSFSLASLCLCIACSHNDASQDSHAAAHKDECQTLAESRLGLYVHSDIYPLSEQEKHDALAALASECMKQYGAQPRQAPPVVAATKPAAALPPGMQMEQKEPAPPPAEPLTHKAVAAPVAPVTVSGSSVPPPTPASISVNSPFAAAKPPSPEVALKLRQPLNDYQPPTNDNGKSELENILTKQ